MFKKLKSFGLSLLAAGSLFLGLSSCNKNGVVSGSDSSFVCSDVSAVSYSENLGLDLSFMDSTEGCFTLDEKKFVDALFFLKENYSFFHHTLVILYDDKILVSKTFTNSSTIKYYVSSTT